MSSIDKAAKILIVESFASSRSLLSEILKKHDYKSVQTQPTPKDALKFLEVEQVDWIITTLNMEEDVNAFHLIELCRTVPELNNVTVTAVLDENELEYAVPLFQAGILNYIQKPYNKGSLDVSIKQQCERFEKYKFDKLKISSQYLREEMVRAEKFDKLIDFETHLCKYFPEEVDQYLNYLSALASAKLVDDCRTKLYEGMIMFPNDEAKLHAFSKAIFKEELDDEKVKESIRELAVDSVVVCHSDENVSSKLDRALKELGVENVTRTDSGSYVYEHIKGQDEEPALICLSWKISGISTPALVQKLRSEGFTKSIFIVLADEFQDWEHYVLEEMGIAATFSDEIPEKKLTLELAKTINRFKRPVDIKAIEINFYNCYQSDQQQANELIQKAKELSISSPGKNDQLMAELKFSQGQFDECLKLANASLLKGNFCLRLINLLGKAYLKLGDRNRAMQCFEKAMEINPTNIERLCAVAELKIHNDDNEGAQESMELAGELDLDSDDLHETEAVKEAASGNSEKAKEIMQKIPNLKSIVAFMNNKAISYAINEKYEESLKLYRDTIDSIPEDNTEIKTIVKFNFAFGLIRSHKYSDAIKILDEVMNSDVERLVERAKKLKSQIEKAMEKNIELRIPNSKFHIGPNDKDREEQNKNVFDFLKNDQKESPPGGFGCNQIFKDNDAALVIAKAIEKMPRFKFRSSIQKEDKFAS